MGFRTEVDKKEYFKEYRSLNPKTKEERKIERDRYKKAHPEKVKAYRKLYKLRQKLKKKNMLQECNRCKLTQEDVLKVSINGLEVHHKDRNQLNNNLDNLEILCARCHNVEHSKDIIT